MLCADIPTENIAVADDELDLIINYLPGSFDDPEILQQTFRFYRCMLVKLEKYNFISKGLIGSIIFVLNNSLNTELVEEALHLSGYFRIDTFDITTFVQPFLEAVLVSCNTLIPDLKELDTEYSLRILTLVYQVIAHVSFFYFESDSVKETINKCEAFFRKIKDICSGTVRHFKKQKNWSSRIDLMEKIYTDLYRISYCQLYRYNKKDFINMLCAIDITIQKNVFDTYNFFTYPVIGWLSTFNFFLGILVVLLMLVL